MLGNTRHMGKSGRKFQAKNYQRRGQNFLQRKHQTVSAITTKKQFDAAIRFSHHVGICLSQTAKIQLDKTIRFATCSNGTF